MKKLFLILFFIIAAAMPMAAMAGECDQYNKGIFKGAYPDQAPCIIDSFPQAFIVAANVLNILLGLAAALFGLFFVLGGVRYITSAGISDRVAEAKNTLINTVVGLVVILLVYGLLKFFTSALGGGVTPK